MKKIGFIFPGQGSQITGMGLDLYNNFESAKEIYNRADEILGKKISKICFNGPDDELKKTINAQSAIVTTSIACMETFLSKCDIKPSIALGHSLGEYCALYTAGVMDLETTLRAIQKRSELMDGATKLSQGTMSAVLGLSADKIQEILDGVQELGIAQIANYNDPGQIVITGEIKAIERANDLLKQAGAKRVVPLAVSGAFHSSLMNSASGGFADFVKDIKLNNAKIPVITNYDAKITLESEDFRDKMPKQIKSSVMWVQSIQKCFDNEIDTFIEFGAGKVLAGLNRKISPTIKTYNVFDSESLNKVIEELLVGV